MEYRELPNGGLKVSAVIMGCWQFCGGSVWGGEYTQDTANQVVASCLENGINTFDTAEIYGNGLSETMLGRALDASGVPRDRVVVAKFRTCNLTYKNVTRHLEVSLRRVNLDYIDLYQLHWPPPSFTREQACDLTETAHRLVESGKVRSMAVSNFRAGDFTLFDDLSWMASNQIPYSLLWRYYDVENSVAVARKAGIGHLAYSPLAQGLLSGRFDASYIASPGHTRSSNRLWCYPVYGESLRIVELLKETAAQCGKTPSQTALNWILSRPGNFSVIVGARNIDHVIENIKATGWALDKDLAETLDAASLDFQSTNLETGVHRMWSECQSVPVGVSPTLTLVAN